MLMWCGYMYFLWPLDVFCQCTHFFPKEELRRRDWGGGIEPVLSHRMTICYLCNVVCTERFTAKYGRIRVVVVVVIVVVIGVVAETIVLTCIPENRGLISVMNPSFGRL